MNKNWFLGVFCVLAFISCSTCSFAVSKSDKLKPKWVTQTLPESKSGTYIFVSSHGQGSSLVSAKQQAFVAMSQKLEVERGLVVNTSIQIKEQMSQTQSFTESEYSQEITLDVTENGHKLKIVCREIDDYWVKSHGKYEVDVLYTVANTNMYGGSFDDEITVTSKYGAAGFMSLIPSVGQFYKGSAPKGSMILASEVAAIVGLLVCESTRASYVKKMIEQPKHASEYNSLADTWETGRNICIGAATAIYVYNLIDAFFAPGAKRIMVENERASFSAIPYYDDQSFGIDLAIKF